jgi:hypothetical protein
VKPLQSGEAAPNQRIDDDAAERMLARLSER